VVSGLFASLVVTENPEPDYEGENEAPKASGETPLVTDVET